MPIRRQVEQVTVDQSTSGRSSRAAFGIVVPPWMDDALCAQTDPEAFFPEKGGSTKEAKAICARCPVAAECLDYALGSEHGASPDRFGIWGGLSERERRALSKQMKNTSPDQQESA